LNELSAFCLDIASGSSLAGFLHALKLEIANEEFAAVAAFIVDRIVLLQIQGISCATFFCFLFSSDKLPRSPENRCHRNFPQSFEESFEVREKLLTKSDHGG
jgi:hypothetical protein